MSKKIMNKRESFTEEYAIRLAETQIECADALYIISSRDAEESFFYCDPPYPNCDQGHYDGYSMEDFERLLSKLAGIKGKFLLSSYPYPELEKASKENGWFTQKIEMTKSMDAGAKDRKKKIEVLTANYRI